MTHSIRLRISGWRKYLPKILRDPHPWLAHAARATSNAIHCPLRNRVIAAIVSVAAVALIAVPTLTPALDWLPKPGDSGATLGALMAAQAAIAAFTLAVTLFVMQGIRTRNDVDERIHREYVQRSWVRNILWVGLLSVAVTGVILISDQFISRIELVSVCAPGLRNLPLLAGFGFLVNLALAGILFERAIFLSGPEQWMALRRYVNKTDVREAIQAFLRRARRAHAAREANEPDFTTLVPDRGEGSADEAVRALLDDARRAMSERRHEELKRSLASVRELVKYAMDEIKKTDIRWSAPGGRSQSGRR